MKKLQLILILMSFIFLQCSSSGDPDPAPVAFEGNFELALSGDISQNLEGEAIFLHAIVTNQTDEENGSIITITLVNDADEDEIITLYLADLEDLNGLDPGSFPVELEPEDESSLASLYAYLGANNQIFFATSGTITIDKIEEERVEGSVSAVLEDAGGNTVSLIGDFNASGVTERL